MARAVGIDLGTTNSVIAVLEGGDPTIVPNAEGGRTTPSVVASKDGEILVGEVAKRQAITNPDRTFRSIKRHMGESWKSDDIDGKTYTPQEISARTLQKLKRDAEAFLRDKVTEAVSPQVAYLMNQALTGVVRQGTGKTAGRALERTLAGKTGTTDDWRDSWTICYTPELVTGAWVGNADGIRTLGEQVAHQRHPRCSGERDELPELVVLLLDVARVGIEPPAARVGAAELVGDHLRGRRHSTPLVCCAAEGLAPGAVARDRPGHVRPMPMINRSSWTRM